MNLVSLRDYLKESIELKEKLFKDKVFLSKLKDAIALIDECFSSGNKVLIAGNGGSAADAQHFAGEIVCRFKKERKGYPAIALTVDTSVITAWSNDKSFSDVFSRQVEALGKPNDVFIGISTSGRSVNIIRASEKAWHSGMKTVSLVGEKVGRRLKDISDITLAVPSANTPRIQEVHILLLHIIAEEVEKNFLQE